MNLVRDDVARIGAVLDFTDRGHQVASHAIRQVVNLQYHFGGGTQSVVPTFHGRGPYLVGFSRQVDIVPM